MPSKKAETNDLGSLQRLNGPERTVLLNKYLRKNRRYRKVEVRYSPHKGVFMVARQDIKKGERVFKEQAVYSADGVNSHYFCFQCKCLHCAFEKTCKVCTDPEAWYEDVEEDDSDDEEESYQPLVLPRCDEFKSFQRQVPAALKYIHGLKFDADYLKFVLMYSYEKALDPESSIWALTVNLHRETKLGRKRQNNYAAIAGLIKALKPKFRKQVPMRRTGNDLLKILDTNCFSNSLDGTDLYPVTALMEHSCSPNLECEDGTEEFAVNHVNALKNIKKGTHLSFSYDADIEDQSVRARREFLRKCWAFHCRCAGCAKPKKRKRVAKKSTRRVRRKLK